MLYTIYTLSIYTFYQKKNIKKTHTTHSTLHKKKKKKKKKCMCQTLPSTYSPLFSTGAPSKVQSQYPATDNLFSKIMYISELTTFFC